MTVSGTGFGAQTTVNFMFHDPVRHKTWRLGQTTTDENGSFRSTRLRFPVEHWPVVQPVDNPDVDETQKRYGIAERKEAMRNVAYDVGKCPLQESNLRHTV